MTKTFSVPGTFQSYYAADKWLKENGYESGSMCRDMPIAITKGEYNLPEKYKNMTTADKKAVNGWITSNDFREGSVTIEIFE